MVEDFDPNIEFTPFSLFLIVYNSIFGSGEVDIVDIVCCSIHSKNFLLMPFCTLV